MLKEILIRLDKVEAAIEQHSSDIQVIKSEIQVIKKHVGL
jgi:hypothetical protein